jgi:hypothetical protein
MFHLGKAVGAYFFQLIWQGLILGILGFLGWYVPWPYNIIPVVVGLYLLWRLGNNPRTFWKRMFMAFAVVPLVGSGLDIATSLNIDLGPWFTADTIAQYAPGINPYLVFGIALVIATADLLNELFYLKAELYGGQLWARCVDRETKITKTEDGGFRGSVLMEVGLQDASAVLSVTDLILKLRGVPFWITAHWYFCEGANSGSNFSSGGMRNIPKLQTNGQIQIRLFFTIEKSWRSQFLFAWKCNIPFLGRRGVLQVIFNNKRMISAEIKSFTLGVS